MPSYWETVDTATAAYAMPGQAPTLADYTGNGLDGAGAVAAYTTGPHGMAFSFDGLQQVTCPQLLPTGSAPRAVFCRHNSANTGYAWGQTLDDTDGAAFRFRPRNHSNAQGLLSGPRIEFEGGYRVGDTASSGWTSSAVVVPNAAVQTADVQIYANGLLLGISGQSAAPQFDSAPAAFSIGNDTRNLAANALDGEIAELIVFNHALAAEDVSELHEGPEPTPTAVGGVALTDSFLSWSGWSWEGYNNGAVNEVFDILRDGEVVLAGVVGASQDIASFGAGVYSVRARASNDGGASPSSVALSTNSAVYPGADGLGYLMRLDSSDLHVPGLASSLEPTGEVIS